MLLACCVQRKWFSKLTRLILRRFVENAICHFWGRTTTTTFLSCITLPAYRSMRFILMRKLQFRPRIHSLFLTFCVSFVSCLTPKSVFFFLPVTSSSLIFQSFCWHCGTSHSFIRIQTETNTYHHHPSMVVFIWSASLFAQNVCYNTQI